MVKCIGVSYNCNVSVVKNQHNINPHHCKGEQHMICAGQMHVFDVIYKPVGANNANRVIMSIAGNAEIAKRNVDLYQVIALWG